MTQNTDDLRIERTMELLPPVALMERFPISDAASETVFSCRQSIHNMLYDQDDRVLVVVGPCSIHDVDAAIDYAQRLMALREQSPVVLNGSGFGLFANHSLVMASYISRANAGIIDLRELLAKG